MVARPGGAPLSRVRESPAMAGRWRSRTYFLLGIPAIVAGILLILWERVQSADIELVAAPPLLVGLLFPVEGTLARRREHITGDNPK